MLRLSVLCCAFLISGCSSAAINSPLPVDSATRASVFERPVTSGTFKSIFSFNGGDGKAPAASLADYNGALAGTTYGGGKADSGTAYRITPSGKESLLHTFRGGTDGALPESRLLAVGTTLYGTTINGGGPGDEGIVYAIAPSGKETILHRFSGGDDGANPYDGLTGEGGALFGTTAAGGSRSSGTVFTISASGTESVLYSFGAYSNDGATPVARLLDASGTFYGTTVYGGGHCGSSGCGTVFKITPSGTETVVYAFKGGKDGAQPMTPLVEVHGNFYGTTSQGGSQNAGTVFEITSAGAEKLLYTFKGGADGAIPQELIAFNGTLYGTTSAGGSKNDGTIFALSLSGKKSLLYSFTGGKDGAEPRAGLHELKGRLYGTTGEGGSAGAGTVFSISG